MPKSGKMRPAFTIMGFVFGASAAGFAISNALVSLLVILSSSIGGSGWSSLSLDLTSEIAITLCIGIFILGLLLLRGSLMIWRLSVLGGAINLASGIVLAGFSYAMISVALGLLEQVYSLVFAETVLMSLFAVLSGFLAVTALFEQLQRRFSPSQTREENTIRVSVVLPGGDAKQMELLGEETLSDLREKIRETEGSVVSSASFIFRGRKIADESRTLKELGVREGDKITLV